MRSFVLLCLFVLLLATYTLPWVINPGAGLSLGGYDLAEWASVHPISGGESPPLLTALLLRLPLVCATLAFVFFLTPNWNTRIVGGIAILLMAAALLPPFEFLNDSGNWNYRQQLGLAFVTLTGGAFALTGWMRKYRTIAGTVIAVIGIVACLMGLSRAMTLMQGFNLPTQIGVGGVGTAFLLLVLILLQLQIGRRITTRHPIQLAKAN